eukprot:881751-Prorocentrum_minimum.AAC.1
MACSVLASTPSCRLLTRSRLPSRLFPRSRQRVASHHRTITSGTHDATPVGPRKSHPARKGRVGTNLQGLGKVSIRFGLLGASETKEGPSFKLLEASLKEGYSIEDLGANDQLIKQLVNAQNLSEQELIRGKPTVFFQEKAFAS